MGCPGVLLAAPAWIALWPVLFMSAKRSWPQMQVYLVLQVIARRLPGFLHVLFRRGFQCGRCRVRTCVRLLQGAFSGLAVLASVLTPCMLCRCRL